jgi:hypothetical protein
MVRHIRLHRNELCPCRSGWLIVSCCLDPSDGKLRKKVKSIKPPGPATNYAHPNCYLRTTSDCSEEISREHYVSANILEQLGSDEGIEVFGLPWFNPGKGKRLSVDNLTSKILCKRHNENLSPLDHEAGIFFRELTAALSILDRKSSSKKSNFRLVSGAALELWLLKTACGLYFSTAAAKDGERLAKTHSIDLEKIKRAFFDGVWDDRAGLYFTGQTGSILTFKPGLQLAPLTRENVFGGIRVALRGMELDLFFDTSSTNSGEWSALTHRPSELIFEKGGRDQRLVLTWPPGVPQAGVVFSEKPALT